MQPLVIDNEFFDIFPEANIFALVVKGIDNHASVEREEHNQQLLDEAMKMSKVFLTEEDFKDNQLIQEWRQAFTSFKKKKGARSSIEALLKRVNQGKQLTPINPLVDIYNSVSLEYGVPCGGEDLQAVQVPMHLGLAKGGEYFIPVGADESEPALPEELIYYDSEGAICRSLNWRDAQRTMLTEDTQDAILIIEGITEQQKERGAKAILELQNRIESELGVKGETFTITANQ